MLETTVETITPEMAAKYLKSNVSNYRKMSRSVVMKYAEDIAAEKWQLNGEAICFDENGKLKDGQHRLSAIIYAGKPITTVVIRGVKNNVNVYDVGSTRTVTQIANAEGIDCNPTVSAVANIVVNRLGGKGHGCSERLSYIRNNIDELNRAYRVACYGDGKVTKTAPCVTAAYLFLRTNTVPVYTAELYFRLLNNPYTTRADGYIISPATICRKMLDERRNGMSGSQIQKERLEIVSLGLRDFGKGVDRKTTYKIQEPFYFTELLTSVRKMDGLEA